MTKTNNNNKLTQVQALQFAINHIEKDEKPNTEVIEKLSSMIDTLNRKKSSGKSKKADPERDKMKKTLYDYITSYDKTTYPDGIAVCDIMKDIPLFTPSLEMSSQKVSRLLIELTEEKPEIKATVVKGRKRFTLEK